MQVCSQLPHQPVQEPCEVQKGGGEAADVEPALGYCCDVCVLRVVIGKD